MGNSLSLKLESITDDSSSLSLDLHMHLYRSAGNGGVRNTMKFCNEGEKAAGIKEEKLERAG